MTLLATRAGTPAWGPEVLARHHWFRIMGELPGALWHLGALGAEVSESHSNYPSLMWFRSPVPTRSWLTALTSMLDAAALHDATCPQSAPRQARTCLQMGTDCLRSLARTSRIAHDADPLPTAPIRLSYANSPRATSVCSAWGSRGAPARRGVATFHGVACQLRAHRGPADPHDHAPARTLVCVAP